MGLFYTLQDFFKLIFLDATIKYPIPNREKVPYNEKVPTNAKVPTNVKAPTNAKAPINGKVPSNEIKVPITYPKSNESLRLPKFSPIWNTW